MENAVRDEFTALDIAYGHEDAAAGRKGLAFRGGILSPQQDGLAPHEP